MTSTNNTINYEKNKYCDETTSKKRILEHCQEKHINFTQINKRIKCDSIDEKNESHDYSNKSHCDGIMNESSRDALMSGPDGGTWRRIFAWEKYLNRCNDKI
jgi:hypothetical protein